MPPVTYLPTDRSVEVDEETTLLQAAREAGVPIATVCGGCASCTRCKVVVEEGEEHLSPMEFSEEAQLGNTFFITKERLACQTRVTGPVVVRVVNEEAADKRGRARARALRRGREDLARRAARLAGAPSARPGQAAGRDGGDGPAPKGDKPAGRGRRRRRRPRGKGEPGKAPARAPAAKAEGGKRPEDAGKEPTRRRRRRRRRRPRRKGGGGAGKEGA